MSTIKTDSELAAAIKSHQSTIEIEGDLAKKVIRLKATGPVAWAIAIGCIGIAAIATAATLGSGVKSPPAVRDTPLEALMAATEFAISLEGPEVAAVATTLAVVAVGVSLLSRVYSGYRIAEKSAGRVVLVRK